MKSNKKFTCVIPVRFNSTRFPGKPLKEIDGVPMIQRVLRNAKGAQNVDEVIVAAYGEEMVDYCKENDVNHVAVDLSCENGSEAVADVVKGIETDYAFELQGDQPLVSSEIIDDFLEKASEHIDKNDEIDIVQPYAPTSPEQIKDVDVVKVVVTHSGRFASFSRQPIETGYRTLGLYVWKRSALLDFSKLSVSDYEKAETTHLVRFTMNDLYVQGVQIDDTNWIEVDRPEHIAQVERVLAEQSQ